MGLTTDEQQAIDAFQRDVVEPSMSEIVIIDFWAEWCGPCKSLTPVIEKVAADYAEKGVRLVKVNVDEESFIASQFQIQSIPTVYAMFQGQPVANLSNARTEAQLKTTLDQLLAKFPVNPGGGNAEPDLEPLLAMGEDVLASGDAERAHTVFAQILDMVPDNVAALSGLLRALIAGGQIEQAEALLAQLPEAIGSDTALDRVRSTLALAADKPDDTAAEALRTAVETSPEDHEKRLELACALFASGDRDGAADHLLAIVRADKDWNEGAARAKLLQIFEAIGLEDPWVSATRRKLSAAIFG